MLHERDNAIGIFKGPRLNNSIFMVVDFIEKHLKEFSSHYTRSKITNEKGLTQELCILLNLYAHKEYHPFWFEKEYMEEPEKGDSPQIDLAVLSSQEQGIIIDSKCFSNRETFFSIEAKRLFRISSKREKEYLVGRNEGEKYKECGGVERFKNGIHGIGLSHGALVGYVQEHDFNYWHERVNSWVEDLINGKIITSSKWTETDKLEKVNMNSITAKYKSENLRETDSIILFHLWVNLV